jgi:hypothetical protein
VLLAGQKSHSSSSRKPCAKEVHNKPDHVTSRASGRALQQNSIQSWLESLTHMEQHTAGTIRSPSVTLTWASMPKGSQANSPRLRGPYGSGCALSYSGAAWGSVLIKLSKAAASGNVRPSSSCTGNQMLPAPVDNSELSTEEIVAPPVATLLPNRSSVTLTVTSLGPSKVP